ncbi:MAG TPA: hypothetical protein VF942_14445, partial [Acidimicrobiales bacterium]
RMDRTVAICAEAYNAGLQHRRDAWRMAGVSVSLFDQFGEIKDLRGRAGSGAARRNARLNP